MTERLKNLVALLLSLTISLIACEAGLRLWGGVPLFEFPDFRLRQVIRDTLTGALEYDAKLGWRLKSNLSFPNFHTIDYGIRRNGPTDDHVRTGGVLVVGASFTAGSEVDDEGAWPAQLETLAGQSVVNGGEGGFGADQIVLRAEELLPIVRPTMLVVDLVSDNITTAGYSYAGYPKPYFTIDHDQLVLNNSPVPRYQLASKTFDFTKDVLAYSYIVDRIMATFARDYWYTSTGAKFERIKNDDVEVTCKLLQRLKQQARKENIRTLVSVQYGGNYIVDAKTRTGSVVLVEECARSMGFQVVDEFDYLKKTLNSDPALFARHYVTETNGLYGHKSVFGNRQIAGMVYEALAKPPPAEVADTNPTPPEPLEVEPAETKNLLSNGQPPAAWSSGIVSVKPVSGQSISQVFDILSIGGNTEHYAATGYESTGDRQFILSLDVRAKGTSNGRIQLLDPAQNGAYVDFDLGRKTITMTRLGLSRNIDGGMTPIGDGWYHVWVTARLLKDGNGVIILQLASGDANWVYSPHGESISVRAVSVRKGGAATQAASGVQSN
jgi:hypothetical protein